MEEIVKYLNADDITNFAKTVCPGSDIFERRRMDLESRIYEPVFLNNQKLPIRAHVNRLAEISTRVEIRIDSIVKILDESVIDAILEKYGTIRLYLCVWEIGYLIEKHQKVHLCGDGKFNICVNSKSTGTCNHNHFHHYCPLYVKTWFEYYVEFYCYFFYLHNKIPLTDVYFLNMVKKHTNKCKLFNI